jgi:geranylgeranyl pyrophosphate synthase
VKRAEADKAPASAIAALLERTFRRAGAQSHVTAPGFPDRLWQQALLAPLHEFLSRPGKQFRARLVELAFVLAGGDAGHCPPELPLLIEVLHAGSLIVDDIEDGSPMRRGSPSLHARYGVPLALNAGNWLYFWAQALLARAALPGAARLLAHERIAARLLACHEGQALDLSVRVSDLAQREVAAVVHTVSALKTGGLLALAMELGAIAAHAPPHVLEALGVFGCEVGIGLQMFDDVSGVLNPKRRDKACEDLRHARATWLWAWLAERTEANDYESSRAELRAILGGAAPDRLLERMRFRTGGSGRQYARVRLERALAELASELGARCDALGAELARQFAALAQQYVAG